MPPLLYQGDQGPTYGQTYQIPDTTIRLLWIQELQAWMGETEITTRQYKMFDVGHYVDRVKSHSMTDDAQPVVNVSYTEVEAFLAWLNEREQQAKRLPQGWRYALPTAKQWRYCATSGKPKQLYPWGSQWPPTVGNYGDLSAAIDAQSNLNGYNDGMPVTCDVTKSGANPFGLYGMSGNAFEWVDEWYTERRNKRLLLGGSWRSIDTMTLETRFRAKNRPTYKSDDIGFRIILTYTESN